MSTKQIIFTSAKRPCFCFVVRLPPCGDTSWLHRAFSTFTGIYLVQLVLQKKKIRRLCRPHFLPMPESNKWKCELQLIVLVTPWKHFKRSIIIRLWPPGCRVKKRFRLTAAAAAGALWIWIQAEMAFRQSVDIKSASQQRVEMVLCATALLSACPDLNWEEAGFIF